MFADERFAIEEYWIGEANYRCLSTVNYQGFGGTGFEIRFCRRRNSKRSFDRGSLLQKSLCSTSKYFIGQSQPWKQGKDRRFFKRNMCWFSADNKTAVSVVPDGKSTGSTSPNYGRRGKAKPFTYL